MGKRTSPRSNRAKYQFKIGGNSFVARLKITTGNHLGLKALPDLPKGKGKSTKRGVKGTKSFKLILKKPTTIDGVRIQQFSFPVEGGVTLREFYTYAKKTFSGKGVSAIITPDGIQHAWDKIERPTKGLSIPGLPNLPTLPGLDISGLIDQGIEDLGGYIGRSTGLPGAESAGRLIGDYLNDYL